MYAVTQQWPAGGRWVLQFVGTDHDRVTSTLVATGPGRIERQTAKSATAPTRRPPTHRVLGDPRKPPPASETMTARYPQTMIFGMGRPAASPSEEEVLVRSASSGDRAAFEEIYNRYSRLVHAILLARVPLSDAEDLVQDVFFSVFRRLHFLRAPAAFRAWLCAIARNRATEFQRAAQRERLEQTRPPENPREDQEEAWIVLDVIRSLPEAYRETLICG